MATALTMNPAPVQQQQQQPSLAGQNDPLYAALVKYVTTGPEATHATESEVQQLATSFMSRPGGRAHLEALCHHDDHHPERSLWRDKATAIGHISLNKTSLNLEIKVPSLDVKFVAEAWGFYRPFAGPLNNGTLWYNGMDTLAPGPADFKLHVNNLTLHLDIYRNQVFVASFTCGPIAFTLAPGTQDGSGTFT